MVDRDSKYSKVVGKTPSKVMEWFILRCLCFGSFTSRSRVVHYDRRGQMMGMRQTSAFHWGVSIQGILSLFLQSIELWSTMDHQAHCDLSLCVVETIATPGPASTDCTWCVICCHWQLLSLLWALKGPLMRVFDRSLSVRALTNNLFTNCRTLQYESMWTRRERVYLLTYWDHESQYLVYISINILATSVLWLHYEYILSLSQCLYFFGCVSLDLPNWFSSMYLNINPPLRFLDFLLRIPSSSVWQTNTSVGIL